MCLTHLLTQYSQRHHPGMDIHALTIDHGYRKESSEEAKLVGQKVRQWGVKHHIEKLSYDRPLSTITNFEEVARNLRYKALQDFCLKIDTSTLFVAHTLDDQIETFLQRLQMNSTIHGLIGLKLRSPIPVKPAGTTSSTAPIELLRPLLTLTKKQVTSYCRDNRIEWFEDSTNADPTMTRRNWLRFMISEYVPKTGMSSHIISRDEILKSIHEVDQVRRSFEKCIAKLDDYVKKYGLFQFDQSNATINFTIESLFWLKLNASISARWLYDIMYPLSSSENFHWSYAKIERQAIPRIGRFIEDDIQKIITLTYLNVKIVIFKEPYGMIKCRLMRQPAERERRQSTTHLRLMERFLEWLLVNNIWWLRLKDDAKREARIQLYNPVMKKDVKEVFPQCGKLSPEIPIVLDASSSEILAVPTMGLAVPELQVEWSIKKSKNLKIDC